jgi:hypothetical protein
MSKALHRRAGEVAREVEDVGAGQARIKDQDRGGYNIHKVSRAQEWWLAYYPGLEPYFGNTIL